jgi:hypothetical protein
MEACSSYPIVKIFQRDKKSLLLGALMVEQRFAFESEGGV